MAVIWNLDNAGHLLRRTAFGGAPKDIQSFFKRHKSVSDAVGELLNFQSPNIQPPTETFAQDFTPQQEWWFQQMISAKTADACREKLVVFWHSFLVSGVSKQHDGSYMPIQNALFRQNAKGNYKDLLRAFQRDAANLYYLDGIHSVATADRKNVPVPAAQPNENFGREVMELFSLGLCQLASDGSFDASKPNYTENDVHQLSRALTGWNTIVNGQGVWNGDLPYWDGGRCDDNGDGVADPVTIFGITDNNFRIDDAVKGTKDDIVELLCSRRDSNGNNQAAMFVARKFWSAYGYPPPSPGLKSLLAGFAKILVAGNFELAPMLQAMWTSDEFYSDNAKARIVKSPVDFIVGAMKTFGLTSATPVRVGNSSNFGKAAADMGMSLFNPPSVAGWQGGMAWMNSGTLLARLSFVKSLAQTGTKAGGYDLKIIPGMPRSKTSLPTAVLAAVLNFLGLNSGALAITPQENAELLKYISNGGPTLNLSNYDFNDGRIGVRGLIALALQTPEYMLF